MEGRYHRQLKLSPSGDCTLRFEKEMRLDLFFKIVPTVLIRRFNIGKINIYEEAPKIRISKISCCTIYLGAEFKFGNHEKKY